MRVFPDTNVLISAFLSDGTCYCLIQHLISRPEHMFLIGEAMLEEARRKLYCKLKAPEAAIEMFVELQLGGVLPSPRPNSLPDIAPRSKDGFGERDEYADYLSC